MSQSNDPISRRTLLRGAAVAVGSSIVAGCIAEPPPPPPPGPPPAAMPPPPYAQPMPPPRPVPRVAMRQTKAQAHYQWRPHGRQHCALCVHFRGPHGCEIVRGYISPRGWCRNFRARV
jgi:hypothetical protein